MKSTPFPSQIGPVAFVEGGASGFNGGPAMA